MSWKLPTDRSSLPADWPNPEARRVNGGYYTEPVSFPWPDRATGPWWITVRWCFMYGKWEAVGISVDWAPGATVRPLQRKHLASIKMGDVLDRAARELEKRLDDPACFGADIEQWSMDYDETGEVVTTKTFIPDYHVAPEARPKRLDRPPRPPSWVEETVRIYNEAYTNGQNPTKAVREHFGIGRDNAARYVWLCRHKYHLLPETQAGYARGSVPPQPKED